MKKLLTTAVMAALVSMTSFAQDKEAELKDAPQETIMSMIALCKNYAVEDQVSDSEMTKYLLVCVNDELEMNDFKPIKALPNG